MGLLSLLDHKREGRKKLEENSLIKGQLIVPSQGFFFFN
jgi:hypothetical protein